MRRAPSLLFAAAGLAFALASLLLWPRARAGTPAGPALVVALVDASADVVRGEDWLPWARAELRRTAQEAVATAAATPSAASDPRLDEPCDLTRDEKLELLQFEDTLAKANHWQLLGLTGDPSSSAIKRAYFSQSRRFHPDRFFGRNTGSFGARLDTIFMALKTAYAVLSNEEQRRAYAAHTPAKKDR